MKIISFNINGLRARLHQLQALIDKHQPDVIGLQEIKVHDEAFPVADVEAMGYHVEIPRPEGSLRGGHHEQAEAAQGAKRLSHR